MSYLRDIQRVRQYRSVENISRSSTKANNNLKIGYKNKQEISKLQQQAIKIKRRRNSNFQHNDNLSKFKISLNQRQIQPYREKQKLYMENILSKKLELYYKQKTQTKYSQNYTIDHFLILFPIGKGGFGKVWKVKSKQQNKYYAMKQMNKAKIYTRNSVKLVMNQLQLLKNLQNPFIINIHCAFQTSENIYMVMDYLDGGNLRYHMKKRKRFQENQVKFFIANIIVGLVYLRQNKIIHRDLKPQNLVFDVVGYLRITDLGISRYYKKQNSQQTSGTPGYMAPQVMNATNHTYSVDYFALGIIAYELMLNRRPIYGSNIRQIRQKMRQKQIKLSKEDLPYKWSQKSMNFINKLLVYDQSERLGSHNISQILNDPWFQGLDWRKLMNKQTQAPFIPRSIEDYYTAYKQQISNDTNLSINQINEHIKLIKDKDFQKQFSQYYYNKNSDKNSNKKYKEQQISISRNHRNRFYIQR